MSQMHHDPQQNSSDGLRSSYARRLLGSLFSMPDTDAQDCESVDWAIEMYDWAEQVAHDTGCPPESSHLFGCDRCFNAFDFYVRIIEWGLTEEGSRYNRESRHWSWHTLYERQEIALMQPRNDLLQEGDRDWMLIGRQPPPDSMPR